MIDNLSREEIYKKVSDFFVDEKFHCIVTVNPEIWLETRRNERYRSVIASADMRVADGFGMNLFLWRQGKHLKHRITGADLAEYILEIADRERTKIFLIATRAGLSSYTETRSALSRRWKNITVVGEDVDPSDTKGVMRTLQRIAKENPRVVLCNFGAPRQELFLSRIEGIGGIGIGVGGTFDFWTGKVSRAPRVLRRIGLEWLWRLWKQPRRWRRIFRAVIVFPLVILFHKR